MDARQPGLARLAPLRRFDVDLLCGALGYSAAEAAAILASDAAEPAEPGGLRLRPDLVAEALAQLRAAGPAEEIAVHQAALAHYRARLAGAAGPARDADEDECMHHLDALFIQVGAQGRWAEVVALVLELRAAGVAQARHLQRLAMVEGYAAIYQLEIARGSDILRGLLAGGVLEADVEIKARKGLADGAIYQGRYAEARTGYEELLAAATRAGDLAYQGLAHMNMGSIHHNLGESEAALAECERSLAIFRQAGDQLREAYALHHAALYSLYVGRWEAARSYSVAARGQFERLGLTNYLGYVAWVQGYLADILGEEGAAEAAYHEALAAAEGGASALLSLAADALLHLGLLYQSQGRHELALAHYGRALAHAEQLERQHQISLLLFRRGQVLEQIGRPGRAYLCYRAAIAGVERMGGSTTREDVKISLLGTTQQIYEAMVLLCMAAHARGGRARWLALAVAYIERARSRAFLDALARRAGDRPEQDGAAARLGEPAALAAIQRALPEDALLIEYFTTGVLPRGEQLIARLPAENRRLRALLALPPRVLGFAISRDRCAPFAPALDPNRLRPLLGDRHPGRHLLLGPLPTTLYRELVAPAEPLLAGRRLLYLAPHGPLHYVPFAALRTAEGVHLIDLPAGQGGLAIAQAPSATALVRSAERQPREGGAALAIGFDDAGGGQPLRFAEAEAEHIGRLLGGEAWAGPQPKRAQLQAAGPRLRRLHIAGHALFTPDDPLGSWLLLGGDDALSAREIVAGLELGAELVTLSSCTSGISHVVPGDELLGLPRALLLAGAATIVCTRWEAIDIVALLVMDRFYRELAQHSPAVALRNAQVAVRGLRLAELAEIFDGWRREGGALAAALGDPQALLAELAPGGPGDSQPFAAPLLWAPFMVIGRG